jgi:hypothetical protein
MKILPVENGKSLSSYLFSDLILSSDEEIIFPGYYFILNGKQ